MAKWFPPIPSGLFLCVDPKTGIGRFFVAFQPGVILRPKQLFHLFQKSIG